MAIENIEQKCLNRKSTRSGVRHPVNAAPPKDLFNSFDARCTFAKLQLKAIQNYMKDFKEISD